MKTRKHTITKQEMHLLTQMKKHKHDHRLHKLHKKHKISYKTLFYMKEYGPRSHVATVIVRESIKILILASLISSLGGVQIKGMEDKFVALLPLVILLPALNDMIGDFGTIAASKFTTMLFLGRIKESWWKSPEVRHLVKILLAVALISSVYIGALSYALAYLRGFGFTWLLFGKVIALSMIASICLVGIIISLSVIGGLWIFHKKEDPNNFLIPITTSLADLGSLVIFSLLVQLLF